MPSPPRRRPSFRHLWVGVTGLVVAFAGSTTGCDGDLFFPGAPTDGGMTDTAGATDTAGSTGACSGCVAGSRCHEATGTCLVGCVPGASSGTPKDSPCIEPTSKCDPLLAVCVECQADGECKKDSKTPHCNVVGRCVECRTNEDCAGSQDTCSPRGTCERPD